MIKRIYNYCLRKLAALCKKHNCMTLYYHFEQLFTSEQNVVFAGIREFNQNRSNIYLLRRNIHRLEKGLRLRAPKQVFATSYITETVNHYISCSNSQLDKNTEKWAKDILSEYFEKTAVNNIKMEANIIHAHRRFCDFEKGKAHNRALFETSFNFNEPRNNQDFRALKKMANSRTSVRSFTNMEVERDKIVSAISIAALAPSACNRQPLHYRVFYDKKIISQLKNILMGFQTFKDEINLLVALIADYSAYKHVRDRHLVYIDGGISSMLFLMGLETQELSACIINWPDIHEKDIQLRDILKLKPFEQCIIFFAIGYPDKDIKKAISVKKNIDKLFIIDE